MLADTDAGSVIVAAQSGSVWGYRLLILQFILMPILFVAQELTVRLGLVTGKGHGELIKEKFGLVWAWISVITLLVCCLGALITELSGLAGVGSLAGIPVWQTMIATVTFLVFLAWTGSYRSVELIALFIGAFELVFLWVAIKAHPDLSDIKTQFLQIPWHNRDYLYLAAGNIGAVIMPWMIFYQQSALLDKGLSAKHLRAARWDTALGAFITQLIMAAILVTTAATLGKTPTPLDSVQHITQALIPSLGKTVGNTLFALGMMGASLVATIVVTLTAAWGLGEVMGYRRSLQDHPREAPWFYSIYSIALIVSGIIVASGLNLVDLSIAVEVMNALLLPIVLGFLYMLAWKALPDSHRLKGPYALFTGIVLGVTALFGLVSGIMGIFS
ncbi:MAG: divalent metal cation transporter [Gammaproteobacteria bacterium]|nr:divalent metal cation transporter [Gammaproteobacteria bacterium]